jgi:hypothetical protein
MERVSWPTTPYPQLYSCPRRDSMERVSWPTTLYPQLYSCRRRTPQRARHTAAKNKNGEPRNSGPPSCVQV